MEPLRRAHAGVRRQAHAGARARGRRAAARPPARLLRQRRHVAARPRPPRPPTPARDRRRPAGLRPGRAAGAGPVMPQLDAFVAGLDRRAREPASRPSSRATRSAAASRCGSRPPATRRWPGSSRSRRRASTWRAGSRSSRRTRSSGPLLALPVPGSQRLVEQFVGRFYRRWCSLGRRAVPDAVVRSFARHLRDRSVASGYLATGRRLLPELPRADRRSTGSPARCSCSGASGPVRPVERRAPDRRGLAGTRGSSCSSAAGTARRSRRRIASRTCCSSSRRRRVRRRRSGRPA